LVRKGGGLLYSERPAGLLRKGGFFTPKYAAKHGRTPIRLIIAFLVLFVLAEDIEGDFAPNSYYPKLNKLLGLPQEQNSPPSFYRMSELWADLQKWSREDRHEELGRFVFRIRGEWRHVGLPYPRHYFHIMNEKI